MYNGTKKVVWNCIKMAEIYNAGFFFWWKLKQKKNVATTTAITNKAEIIETWWETNRSNLSIQKETKICFRKR